MSGCTALTSLISDDCQLTTLDLSDCTALTELYCYNNQIKGDAMDALIESLPTLPYGGMFAVVATGGVNEQNVCTAVQAAAATEKNWYVHAYDSKEGAFYQYQGLVMVDEKHFPDANFRSYVSSTYDKNSDGVLSDAEIAEVTTMDVSEKGISDLTGINFFQYLTLLSCYRNQLTTLDVSGCTALTNLYCNYNQLTTLNVSGCTALRYLYCYGNQISGNQMGALVASLPTVTNGDFHVIDTSIYASEQNVCTVQQVATAKAKGWTVYDFNFGNDTEYAGSDYIEYIEIIRPGKDNIIIDNNNVDDLEQVLKSEGSMTAGSITFDPETYKLTIQDVKISGEVAFVKMVNDKFIPIGMITVEVLGDNEIASNEAEGGAIWAESSEGITFTGSGTLKTIGESSFCGFGAISYDVEGSCSIIIDGPTIEAQGVYDGLYLASYGDANFEMKSGRLKTTATGTADQCFPALIGTMTAGKTVTCKAGALDIEGWQWVDVASTFGLSDGKILVLADAEGNPTKGTATLADEATVGIGVHTYAPNTGNNPCYDLQGRRLTTAPTQKGLYIVGGRKIVVK